MDRGLLGSDAIFSRPATVLFVDLVGFTPLTDRLGRFGSRGTEQLSQILQQFFGQVTDEALELGGDPIAYGGDALTIVFDGAPADTLRAAQALADSVQQLAVRTSGTATLAGQVALETRIGIARGPVSTTVARSSDRSVPLQLGLGLDLAVAAESAAAQGEVVVHELTDVATDQVSKIEVEDISFAPPSHDDLERLVHPVLRGRLSAGGVMLESHRSVTVVFLGFAPVGRGRIAAFRRSAGHLLQSVVDSGGEVVQISGGDKGVVAMLVFGAPVGHDDDALRAVQSVLELRRRNPSVKVGITTGPIFTTILGSPRRRFQAHFGQTLNIAARLMQAAQPRQVLVDAPTWLATSNSLRQRGSPELRPVKGRTEPVEVHEIAGWRRRRKLPPPTISTPLVGREPELAAIEHVLDDLQQARGCLRSVVGDAGIGKSRLVRECIERATTRGIGVLQIDADDYPYRQMSGLWRDLLGSRLGIPASSHRRVWLEALTTRLPDQASQFGVLGPLLGFGRGPEEKQPELPPDIAAELAQSLISRVVLGEPTDGPLLIVVENVHHFAQGSLALLTGLGQGTTGSSVAILTTLRTQSDEHGDRIRVGQRWRLDELTTEASSALTEDTWRQAGGGTPPAWLADAAYRRAGGNPLFLRAVTHQLRRSWQPGDPPPTDDLAGESLASFLAERVDGLDVAPREVLSVLAVARRPCRLESAAAVLAAPLDEGAIAGAAQQLEAGNFIRPVPDQGRARYRIQHGVLQQVVYEQMSHADRDRIHRGLATHLIANGADAREIAEHVRHADSPQLERRWFPRAAAAARRSWDVPEAVEWWRRALPLLSGRERDEAEVELLEVLLVGGHANEALDLANRSAPGLNADSGPGSASTQSLSIRRRIATVEAALVCGDFDRCETESRHVMESRGTENEIGRQRAAELLVRSLCQRGQLEEAVELAHLQLDRARQSDDRESVTTASASLGAALYLCGEPSSAATHYEVARAGAAASGDVVHEIHVLSDLAGCAYAVGDHARCLELLTAARQRADRIGYRRHLVVSLNNEAQLRAALGDRFAAACAAAAFQAALAMGDLASAADILDTWTSSSAALAANPDLWRRLAAVDAQLHRDFETAECNANLAVAAARSGDLDTARRAGREAVTHPAATKDGALARRVGMAQLIVRAKSLKAGQVKKRLDVVESLDAMTQAEDVTEVERAELSLERWRMSQDDDDRASAVADLQLALAVEPSAVVRSWFTQIGADLPLLPEPLPPPVGIGRAETTYEELDAALTRLEMAVGLRPTE